MEDRRRQAMGALEDQQLAKLIMWIPACMSYLVAALALAAPSLREPKQRVRRADSITVATGRAGIAATLVASVLFGCAAGADNRDAAAITHVGNVVRGRQLTAAYGCGTCHTIPGVEGATGQVGRPLAGIANRSYIAGVLVNEPSDMIRWLHDPPAVDSLTTMPNVGLNEPQGRDVAAYLYTLK